MPRHPTRPKLHLAAYDPLINPLAAVSSSLKTSACFALLACIVLPCLAQTPSINTSRKRFLKWAYQDAVGLVHDVRSSSRAPLYALGVAGTLTALSVLDTRIDLGVTEYGGSFGDFLDFANHLGGPEMNLPVVSAFAVSLLTNNHKLQDAAFTSLQSMIYAGVISYGLKYTVGRFRPYEQNGPHRFAPFSGRSSFPSGHTTTAFAVLTPWVLYYPHPVTYGLFALGTGTAIARVVREKHWATDVLAGGALGLFTAYYLTKRHQRKAPRRIAITPVLGLNAASVSVKVNL